MPNNYLTEQQIIQLIFGYYELFQTVEELQKKFYIAHTTTYRYLNNNAARFGYPPPCDSHYVKARKYREEYALGATPKEIMQIYGLNKNTLYTYLYDKKYGGKPEREIRA